MNRLFKLYLLPCSIFILLVFAISYKITPLSGAISYGDTSHVFDSSIINFFSTWQEYFFGQSTFTMLGVFAHLLSSFFYALLGQQNYPWVSYLNNYIPVLTLSLVVFFTTRDISKNSLYAYFAGLFIILNNFTFEQFTIWAGPFFWIMTGFVLLFYFTYRIYSEGMKRSNLVGIVLPSLFISAPFHFVMYFSLLFIFLSWYVWRKYELQILVKSIVSLVSVVLLNLFWLLPFLNNVLSQSAENYYNGNLSGIFNGYANAIHYMHLFNFSNYPGFIGLSLHQSIWQYMFSFSLLIIVVLGLLKKIIISKNKSYVMFLFAIFLIFFNFSLGPNSMITGSLWSWAFHNIPGFGFFRSFSRTIIVCLVAEIYILAFLIKDWKPTLRTKDLFVIIFIVFLISTNLIFFTGNLQDVLGTIHVPSQYFVINEKYFVKNPESFYIISYPNLPYEAYTWSINKKNDYLLPIYFNANFFSKPILYNEFAYFLDRKNNVFSRVFAFEDTFSFYKDYDKDLQNLNIKYVLVRKDMFNILNSTQQIDYTYYFNYFNSHNAYTLIENNDSFALFELKKYSPLFLSKHLIFKKENQTKYKLLLDNLKVSQSFSFLQSFHKDWKLYLSRNTTNSWCEKLQEYDNNGNNVVECKHDQKFFEGEELSYLLEKPIFDDTHKVVNQYANRWTIDPEYIKQNFSKDYYKENPDGSIDVELTLYFKPQSYFYFGLIISGTTLFACLSYLGCDFISRRRKAKKDLPTL